MVILTLATAFSIAAAHRLVTMREPSDRAILAFYAAAATFCWIVYIGS